MAGILLFVLSVSLATTKGVESVSHNNNPNGGFKFPGLRRAGENLEIPDSCKDIGICEDIPNYPEDLVAGLIDDLEKNPVSVFNKDVLTAPPASRRLESDDTELCHSTEKIYAPRAARDVNGSWFFIVNKKEDPQQTFRIEICQSDGSPCSAAAYIQNNYEGRCEQKYISRQMIGIGDQNQAVKLNVPLPSCCFCVLKRLEGMK